MVEVVGVVIVVILVVFGGEEDDDDDNVDEEFVVNIVVVLPDALRCFDVVVVGAAFDTLEVVGGSCGVAIFTIEVSESISLIKRRSSSLAALRSIKFIIILLQIQLDFELLSCYLVSI